MSTERLTEDNILTLFPSAKNFPIKESLSDPYQELMSEMDRYVEMNTSDIIHESINASDMIINDFENFDNLDDFMNRHSDKNQKKIELKNTKKNIETKINSIRENQLRIKFFLEEIEMFKRK